jgi:enoyl-CoA hydratase/carnithine racemase
MSFASPTPKLRVEIEGGVGRLLIDNASRRNAIDFEMWRALPEIARALDDDPDVRVVMLRAAPGLSFCSGADISEFSTVRASAEGGRAYEAANLEAFDALAQMSKPTVAAIGGFCMGGGMGLAASCDLRIAREDAVFAIPAARLGVGYPPAAMAYVTSAVGVQTAMEMFFTARRLDAREALARGFVAQLAPNDGFEDAVTALAKTIAANAPLTLRAAKAAIRAATGAPHAPSAEQCDALATLCFDSADFEEGRSAFLEKRAPKFTGR